MSHKHINPEDVVKRFLNLVVVISLISCIIIPVYAQSDKITTLFLVRHAEKASGSDDPDLTPAGKERADALGYVLLNVKLDAVFATKYKRTQQTAQPAAGSQNLQIETIPSLRQNDLTEYTDKILEKHKGGNILIVSHSNIVPALIKIIRKEEFTIRGMKYLDDNAYDDLFVVSFTERESAVVSNLKYGKQTPIK